MKSIVLDGIINPIRYIARNRSGFVGFCVLIFIVLMSFVGPYIVPLDRTTRIDRIYEPPSWAHPLGTDSEGRDILSQIVHGGKDVMVVAFLAGLITTLIAVPLGAVSAFVGGRVDAVITTITDIILTIPQMPLLLVVAAVMRFDNIYMLSLLLGATAWPGLLRAVRTQVLSIKEKDYVEAARCLDMGTKHIVLKEIIPNMMGYITINFILSTTSAVYAQVGLILFGLVPLSGNNWGIMLNLAWSRGAIFFKDSFWYVMSPVLAITLFQWSMITFTRSLEEIFNPALGSGE
ncbi:MAG: ABC transporter permease [Firmicutes bacterium]|nr:ABC transporter permease [Bacillota bacterium]